MDKNIAQKGLEMAIEYGADKARITYSEDSESSLSILDGKLDKLQSSIGSSLSIQLFTEGRYGSFSTNRTADIELSEFIKSAIASTKLLAPDSFRTLPEKGQYFTGKVMDLRQCDSRYSAIEPSERKEFIFSIDSEVDRSDKRIISVCTEYDDVKEDFFIIDSNGFRGESSQTLFTVSSECTVKGKGDAKPQNFWYDSTMFFDKLPKGCCRKAFDRTIMMLGAKKIKSGKYNIILENTISSKVVAPIFTALSGPSIQQNNSFLIGSLGKRLFPEILTVSDTPFAPGEMGSRFFDSEGLAAREADIIKDGVINEYFLTTYFANKLNMAPTIESVSVPVMAQYGETDLNSIMKSMGSGILITGFNGGNSNGSTGDFSYGIEGFFFENGIIVHPVKEMNMTGNILSLYKNILHIGSDPRNSSRWKIPTLAFEGVDLSGI